MERKERRLQRKDSKRQRNRRKHTTEKKKCRNEIECSQQGDTVRWSWHQGASVEKGSDEFGRRVQQRPWIQSKDCF